MSDAELWLWANRGARREAILAGKRLLGNLMTRLRSNKHLPLAVHS